MPSSVNPVDQNSATSPASVSALQLDAQALLANVLQQLLAATCPVNSPIDAQVLQQLAQDPRLINAVFDMAEQIYDYADPALQQFIVMHDLPLAQILKKSRVIRHYLTQPAQLPAPLLSSAQPLCASESNEADCIDANVDPAEFDKTDQSQHAQQSTFYTVYQPTISLKVPYQATVKNHGFTRQTANSLALSALVDAVAQQPSLTSPVLADSAPRKKVIKMPHFQIANARVGQGYTATLKIQGNPQQAVYLKPDSVSIDADTGIEYDPELQQFVGLPRKAGEYSIRFEYQQAQQWLAGQCAFIITADPRSLWQVNEPAADAVFAKAHQDAALIQQMPEGANATFIAASRRGRSHEHAGSFRDDDFFITSMADSPWSILAVADGAGSAELSREGSRIAVQSAGEVLIAYLTENRQHLDAQLENWQMGTADESSKQAAQSLYHCFHDVFYQVAQSAIAAIEQQASQQQLSAKAFATTLLIAVVRHHQAQTFVSTFWIGDGAIAVYSPDKVRLMGNPDSGEFAGQTRFLDKSVINGFNERVNIGYFEQVSAVILMTDGVSDPKFETDSGLQNPHKWNALWDELQQPLRQPEPEQALLEWLHFFCAGHHDDRTLALLSIHPLDQPLDQLLDQSSEPSLAQVLDKQSDQNSALADPI
ncbi:MAG: protein phosphatase 2C domain-containing protein [Moraxellaceae bacterium]|nr:MAG: protein phosphatase 2C domain-containing protein [Moraxellaceae bacterium]